jgi:hypothetical protein
MNVVSAMGFGGFVALGLWVAAAAALHADERQQRLATNCFLAFAVFVSFAAGLSQRDAWPFSSWTMMVGLTPPATRTIPTLRIVGLDATGGEHDIDYRSWQPLSLEELHAWLKVKFPRLDPAAKERVAGYLLDRANGAREQAMSPAGIAYANQWPWPWSAPTHLLHPAIWSDPERVPRTRFVGLRIYEESWDLLTTGGNKPDVARTLQYEYPSR